MAKSVVRSPQFETDLMYYTLQFNLKQAESDSFDDLFGFARTDLAYAKSMERERQRVNPARTWAEEKAEWLLTLELKRYQAAIGV